MGNFMKRVSECPLQEKPICFHLQHNFTSTGEENPPDDESVYQLDNPYDNLLRKFVAKLSQVREDSTMGESLIKEFPEWNRLTIDNLRSVFIVLTEESKYLMNFRKFCMFLDHVGNNTLQSVRQEKFKTVDTDDEGLITFVDFLKLTYHFSRTVRSTCLEEADAISFVNSLTVPEQLKSALF